MAGYRMSRPMVMASLASCTCVLVGVTARTNNQLDAPWGTDRRHTWSDRNSIGGQRRRHNRKRAEKPQDCNTHIKPPQVSDHSTTDRVE
jgi:hypothetical protein